MSAIETTEDRRTLPPERGTLYLSAPLARTTAALQTALHNAGLPVANLEPGVFATPFSARSISIWHNVFSGVLSRVEMELTKCLLLPQSTKATAADLMQAQSLGNFLSWLEGQWLADVLRKQRLISLFQPIVHAQRPDEVYAYECLLRGLSNSGKLIPPDRLFAAARGSGMTSALDMAALVKAIELAGVHRLETSVFVNINVNAMHNPQRSVATTIAATEATGIPSDRFVFEVVESEEIVDPDGLLQILHGFRREGFRVALDDVGAGYASLNLLARVKPDFMKLDMGLIRNVDLDLYKSHVAGKLLELAKELEVKTVVEGVETIGEWQWLRQHGADFAQGFLFAKPGIEPPTPRTDWLHRAGVK